MKKNILLNTVLMVLINGIYGGTNQKVAYIRLQPRNPWWLADPGREQYEKFKIWIPGKMPGIDRNNIYDNSF